MRRGLLRNVSIAYPGVLGVTTEKGQQDVKPNVLDAPTESYEIMMLRWQTGVFEVGAPPPGYVPPEPPTPPASPETSDTTLFTSDTILYTADAA